MIGMHEGVFVIATHAYIVLFTWITAEQLGAPVPAAPVLIAAGVLSATGQLTIASTLLVGALGCLLGDSIWYAIGRQRGSAVLRVLCKISLEPETCVRRSSEFISRYGSRALVVAKFIPGISAVAVPLAANSNISLISFFVYDVLGSLLYVGAYVAAGRLLGERIERFALFGGSIKTLSLILALIAGLAILGWRLYQKRRFQNNATLLRITPEDLIELIERKQRPYILDLRHPLDMLADPRVIPGAVRITPGELLQGNGEIPGDREIILYCT